RYIGGDDRLPFRQLFIDSFAEHIEYFIGLFRGSRVSAAHDATQRHQVIVQPNWEIEYILTALSPGLDKRFFDLRHLRVEGFAGIGNSLGAGIVLQALVNRLDLLANVANLNDGVVRFRNLVTDPEQQIELLGQVLGTDFQSRIRFDFKRRSVTLAEDRQPCLIGAG